MHLNCIVSLANAAVKLQFDAMERSLRATGCKLPLRVIPYDHRQFDLPKNASWWLDSSLAKWLSSQNAHPTMRKYQCLTQGQYHFSDADIVFLRDPAEAVSPFSGLVTACTEWNKPQWTYTPESAAFLYQRGSTWQQRVFSTGQFAIDRPLYSLEQLMAKAEEPAFAAACLRFAIHEQPGLNQLVLATGIHVTNLTLPPHRMESTWAGDYPGAYEPLWVDADRKPYLIHWAGSVLNYDRPINDMFYNFLTRAERAEWEEQQRERRLRATAAYRAGLSVKGRFAYDTKRVVKWGLGKAGVPPDRFGSARKAAKGASA